MSKRRYRQEALEELAGVLMAISVVSKRLSRKLLVISHVEAGGESHDKSGSREA